MSCQILLLPESRMIRCEQGENLLTVLRNIGVAVNAPCGGAGRCGKCRVIINGEERQACQVVTEHGMVITVPQTNDGPALLDGISVSNEIESAGKGFYLAIDVGTTTVAGSLLEGETGRQLASCSMLNPQASYGADVISRIRHAQQGQMETLVTTIQSAIDSMTRTMCAQAGIQPEKVCVVCVVGNPAMQQFFLGISPENLARIPFSPVLTQARYVPAREYIPCCDEAMLMIVPDISGYVGADTVACILATEMDRKDERSLLVDIGTNGEMVLGCRERMIACSAAAGPALEGANISCGMRGQKGAIDHVWVEDGKFCCSVIGGGAAVGICGSGLIDAVAAALELGLLDRRGRILTEDKQILLRDNVCLTQEDIRQVQMAKGAIAAGIELMVRQMEIGLQDIDRVYLAGAFGTFMNPGSACRIGLLPPILLDKVVPVGNAALSGAKMMACDQRHMERIQQLVSQTEFLELAAAPDFRRSFARNMGF